MIPKALGERKKTKNFNLDTIQFRIDRKTVQAYAKVLGIGAKTIVNSWRQGTYHPVHTMRWDNIIGLAEKIGVPPELLVDEEHYLNRGGYVPYRLVFALYRRGFKPSDLLSMGSGAEKEMWYHFLKAGRPSVRLSVLQAACDKAGMPMAHLFTSMKRVGTSSTFSELHNLLHALSDRDAAFLAGVAKVLSFHPDEETLQTHVNELVSWHAQSSG